MYLKPGVLGRDDVPVRVRRAEVSAEQSGKDRNDDHQHQLGDLQEQLRAGR